MKHIIDEKEARYALTAAIEGGINYWASDVHYTKRIAGIGVRPDLERFYDNLIGIRFKVEGADVLAEHQGRTFRVSVKALQRAADRVVHEKLANTSILTGIISDDIDADAADVIVQVAAFGKLIYG